MRQKSNFFGIGVAILPMNMFFSPVAFIAGLDRIFRIHDLQNPGVAVGVGESTTIMSKFEYADDAALVDADAATATARDCTGCRLPHWCSNGDIAGREKGHAYPPHDARQLNDGGRGWSSEASACSRTFRTQRGLRIHAARWYDGGVTHRSRRGSLADRAVQTANRRAAEALLSQVYVGNTTFENVYSFEYLGAKLQCDGDDNADVRYRMAIAQTTFGSLSSIWADHRLSLALKLMTYQLAVCSTLTHASEACILTEPVMRSVNGFNSRCLPIITGQATEWQQQPHNLTCFLRFASAASVTSVTSYECPRVGWCDAPWWHSQSAAPSTLRAASLWTTRQWRWTS